MLIITLVGLRNTQEYTPGFVYKSVFKEDYSEDFALMDTVIHSWMQSLNGLMGVDGIVGAGSLAEESRSVGGMLLVATFYLSLFLLLSHSTFCNFSTPCTQCCEQL